MKLGIDVYQGDGNINFDLMATTPVSVVICKLSQGIIKDINHDHNREEALRIGREVYSYHYFDYRITPLKQVEFVLQHRPPNGIIIDAEYVKVRNSAGIMIQLTPPKNYEDLLRLFIERLSAVMPISIYSSASFFDTYCPNGIYWASVYPLWVAHYKNTAPALPYPWVEYWGWQFTDRGPGNKFGLVSKQADLSYIRETKEK